MKPSTNQPSVNSTGPATAPSATAPAAGRGGFVMVGVASLGSVAMAVASLLRQAHLGGDPFRGDGAGLERAFRGQLLELRGRVGTALEHLERPLRSERAHATQF